MDILRLNVLLIDEDPVLLNIMEESLLSHGMTCMKATTKSEALKLIEQNSFQVIITDVTMPLNDGLELVKSLSRRIPFVMLLADGDQRMAKSIDNLSVCFLEKADVRTRLSQAAWKAYKRFNIDKQLIRDSELAA